MRWYEKPLPKWVVYPLLAACLIYSLWAGGAFGQTRESPPPLSTLPFQCHALAQTNGEPWPHTYCDWSFYKTQFGELTPNNVCRMYRSVGETCKYVVQRDYAIPYTDSNKIFAYIIGGGKLLKRRARRGESIVVRTDIPYPNRRGKTCVRWVDGVQGGQWRQIDRIDSDCPQPGTYIMYPDGHGGWNYTLYQGDY